MIDDRVCAVCAAPLVPGTAGAVLYPAIQSGGRERFGEGSDSSGKGVVISGRPRR